MAPSSSQAGSFTAIFGAGTEEDDVKVGDDETIISNTRD